LRDAALHNAHVQRNLKAASLSALLFVYLVLLLSTSSVKYFETSHRVTVQRVFDETLFGSPSADAIVAVGLLMLFVVASVPSRKVIAASTAFFAAGLAAAQFGFDQAVLVLGLATVPVVAVLFTAKAFLRSRFRGARPNLLSKLDLDGKRIALIFLIILTAIELGALVRWMSYPVFTTEVYSDPSWRLAELESGLFHIFGLLSPVLLVLMVFSFLYKDFVSGVIRKLVPGGSKAYSGEPEQLAENTELPGSIEAKNPDLTRGSRTSGTTHLVVSKPTRLSYRHKTGELAVLLAAMLISVLVMIYAYLPGVNQTGSGISVDERHYLRWLEELEVLRQEGASPGEIISAVFAVNGGDRPLNVLFMLFLADTTGLSGATIVRFLPVLLAPALVASSYLLVRLVRPAVLVEAIRGRKGIVASTVAMAAALSPQIVVGLYAGILANWLALIPSLFSIVVAVRISEYAKSRELDWRKLSASAAVLLALLTLANLFHVYTWGYLVLALGLFTILSFVVMRKSGSVNRHILLKVSVVLGCVIVASVAADYAKSSLFSVTSGLSQESILAGNTLSPTNFLSRWEALDFTFSSYVGGFLSNPVIMALALLWVFRSSYQKAFDRLLLSMIFLLAIPILFGSSDIQARVFYVVPLFIPALLSLNSLRQQNNGTFFLAISALAISMAVYALRAITNMDLVLPEGYEIEEPFLIP
jgi:hypothetical protein